VARAMPDVQVIEYDPGIPGKDVLPTEMVDYIVCTDVMEHVEEQFVMPTLLTIKNLARFAVLFNIACVPCTSTLPDGRSTHITVRDPDWWVERIDPLFDMIENTRYKDGHLTFMAIK